MEALMNIVQAILGMGAVVILPVMIFLLGLLFRMKIGAALQSGLMISIGFQGLLLVIDLLMRSIKPVVDYYQGMGSGFTTVDIGWAALGATSWTVPFAPLVVPLIILANVVLLRLGLTKVMNVDMWNFIHFLIPGSLAYVLFDSVAIGVVVTVGLSILALFVAERCAPHWEKVFEPDGTTCTCLFNKADIDLTALQERVGFFGNPAFIGLIVGLLLGSIIHQEFQTTAIIGMGLASVLLLISRMVAIMMEGIAPIGTAANDMMQSKIGEDAKLWIGMDVALGLGHPACIICTALCIPFTISLAFLIPNMTYFPIGLLTVVCYVSVMCVMSSNGNLVRSLISCMVSMLFITWGANIFSVEATALINSTQLHVDGLITEGFFGFNLPVVVVCLLSRLLG